MLPLIFFLIASLYSIAGFGGGSSYLALLAYFNTPFYILPILGLVCNLIVVTVGAFSFKKNNEINLNLCLPLILSSAPMAFIGGLIPLKENIFFIILGITLLFASIRLMITPVKTNIFHLEYSKVRLVFWGSILGLVAGMVSIGGGIFLSPLLLSFGWGHPKEVSSTATIFILVNSLFGLAGQITKNSNFNLESYWPLFISVFLGSFLGMMIRNHQKMTAPRFQKVTAILILLISLNILRRLI